MILIIINLLIMASSLETPTTLETDILPSILNNDTSIISNTTDTSDTHTTDTSVLDTSDTHTTDTSVLDISDTHTTDTSVLNTSEEDISKASVSFSIDDLTNMFNKCAYITKCKPNKRKDESSLSFLVKKKLSQSECIKLGTGLEAYFRDFISNYEHITNIKRKNKKGEKEKDHLFENYELVIFF